MHVLVATDAWQPQVNGVVRTLEALARHAAALGARVSFLTPAGFASLPLPFYREIRLALPPPGAIAGRIDALRPDAVHVATEGPIGHAARRYCLRRGRPFTTSFHTRYPDYVAARLPLPPAVTWAWLRRFHRQAAAVLAATPGLAAELAARGFPAPALWPRGVDTDLFRPRAGADLGLPRPVFLSVGRLAVEKNLPAFLGLDLPGSKVVVGDGPAREDLARRFPGAVFLGARSGAALADIYAAADVFVFPSRTDTFGLVLLEALASGLPVAAFPVGGPRDVIGAAPVGVLDRDLRSACLAALALARSRCRDFALARSWEASARQFLAALARANAKACRVGRFAAATA
ncbi:MAG: glycosyltransferase family 1 protein [Xanthobacteraceae bacterium]|nr:glycosyltransferase family 1 protein [Xanthobacteraceae bacterium]